jgi:hypothetical protein
MGFEASEREIRSLLLEDVMVPKRIVLHGPMLLGGKNFAEKLDPEKFPGLLLTYDSETELATATYNKERAVFSIHGSISHVVFDEVQVKSIPSSAPPLPKAPVEAQVDTPQSHVFAGPGKGQTGQSKAIIK